MLQGFISYKGYKYQVEGIDNSNALSLILKSGDYDVIELMGTNENDKDPNPLWERRFDVELAKIKVQTNLSIVDGKKKKAPVNVNMFCRLGALIRYAKSMCIATNEKGYIGMALASNDFEVTTSKDYIIKYPTDDSKIL